jgi:hypothetical protein
MSNLSTQQELERVPGNELIRKKILKRTGYKNTRCARAYKDAFLKTNYKRIPEDTCELQLEKWESRFVLRKRDDSLFLDRQEQIPSKKLSELPRKKEQVEKPITDVSEIIR